MDKKAKKREYKDTLHPMGVYQIKNKLKYFFPGCSSLQLIFLIL